MRRGVMPPAAVMLACASAVWGAPMSYSGHVRCLNVKAEAAVALAAERSPIVHGLLLALEKSDVVVYVEAVVSPDLREYKASMQFVSFTGGQRYLLVQIDAYDTRPLDQVALLGHELCHVMEVADAPEIRDAAGFRRFYQRIGNPWSRGRFETDAAQRMERQVRFEVSASASRPNGVPGDAEE